MKILIFLLINIYGQYSSFAEPIDNSNKIITTVVENELLSEDYTLENIILLSHKSLDKKLNSVLNEIRESCRSCVSTIHEKIGPSPFQVDCAHKESVSSFMGNLQAIPENCYESLQRYNTSADMKTPKYTNEYFFSLVRPKKFDEPFAVSCDLSVAGGGWTVIQRRQDGTENFFRNWTDYVNGFGNLNGEFFIGLEKLYALTNSGGVQELYIILEDFDGVRKYARYDKFRIGNRHSLYTLFVEGFTGDTKDEFSNLSGEKFSTLDMDNDSHKTSCAAAYKGGWWYKACHTSNLNGLYLMGTYSKARWAQGVVWQDFRGWEYSLKYVQMMIRPKLTVK